MPVKIPSHFPYDGGLYTITVIMPPELSETSLFADYQGIPLRKFDISRGHVLLTREGNTLLHDRTVLQKMHSYIEEAKTPDLSDPATRIYFREGGNGFIFLVGDLPLVVKEQSNSRSMEPFLIRMAQLEQMSAEFPPYIQVPKHYGILYSDRLAKEYLLMQKINGGLTVYDIMERPDHYGDAGKRAVEKYEGAYDQISTVISGHGLSPEQYLGDWKEENVLVDFSQPRGSLPFSLWIIDQ